MTIKIHIYLFLTIAYMYATKKLELFVFYYIFVIMHELSHAVMALILKVNIYEITLLPIGANLVYDKRISIWKEIIISLAGPLASFLFAILFENEIYISMNIVIGIFNLIPIYPFDGGRIIRNVLLLKCKEKKAKKYASAISKIFILLLVIFILVMISFYKNYYITFFAFYFAYILKDELSKEEYFNYLQTK